MFYSQPVLGGDFEFIETFTALNVAQHIDGGGQSLGEKDGIFFYKLKSTPAFKKVIFYSDSSKTGCAWKAQDVDVQVLAANETNLTLCHEELMILKIDRPFQVFTAIISIPSDSNKALRFTVHCASSVKDFRYRLRDSSFARELWSSAGNKDGTDVDFKVGDEIFPAHRALLTACCPKLAVLIAEAEEAAAPLVAIDTMEPVVFENLLYFLYTGLIDMSYLNEKQLIAFVEAAETFEIETLKLVAQEHKKGQQPLDEETRAELVMSLV